jgi:hypothetical protein
MLILSIDDLDKMKLEFPQVFRDLFVNAATLLERSNLKLKKKRPNFVVMRFSHQMLFVATLKIK